jgi:dihydrofolate synthase/folylpolyglutamate synthase
VKSPALARLDALSPRGMKLGLDAIRDVLSRLGHPERGSPHVLVGGTNGKGSTAAALSAIFRAAGIRAGLHTSPHLIDVSERIRVDDEDVAGDTLDAALDDVFRSTGEPPVVPVTYFEALTAAAERIFAGSRCRAAVVEVGLGGRLDATNAGDPILSAVTSIDLDHTADLGDTREAIAREKAGIFRPGRPALSGAIDPDAVTELRREADRAGAIFVDVPARTRVTERRENEEGQRFVLETPAGRYALATPLRGAHQAANLAVAVTAAEYLRDSFPTLTPQAVAAGVAAVRWPGRLERFRSGGRTVWLDGCHNPAGARALALYLRERGKAFDLLFGVMGDKDALSMAESLFPLAGRVVLTVPDGGRAATLEDLDRRLGALASRCERSASAAEGFDRLGHDSRKEIVVAGSLYLVGEVRGRLLDRANGRAIA